MGLIREPKNVDFTVESKPWTEVELRDFRKLMTELKSRNEIHSLSRQSGKFNIKKKKGMSKAKNAKRKVSRKIRTGSGLTERKKVIA